MPHFQTGHTGGTKQTAYEIGAYPPAFLEYIWYAAVAYAMLGEAWGIVIPSVGGVVWMLVAIGCFLSVSHYATQVYAPVGWALAAGISMLAIELIFHGGEGESRAISEGIAIIGWLALLVIVQTLALRPGFLQRFALVAFAIGLASLPYISLRGTRAFAIGTGLSNGNVLGMWFGFCTVYFVFWGFQSQKPVWRLASWTTALGCLFIVSITVSRAPLLAIVLACVVGLRSTLKRNFIPLLVLVLLIILVYASGTFDEEIGYYADRGAENSGRDRLWPAALERILDSPWIGVGLGDIRLKYGPHKYVMPHNGPLHIALGTGILPLVCFLAYLFRAGRGALHIFKKDQIGEAALLPPLFVYAFMEIMILDYTFVSPWTVVILGLAARAVYDPTRHYAKLPLRAKPMAPNE